MTLCNLTHRSTTGFPVHLQLPKLDQLMSINSVMPSNHLTLVVPFSSWLQSFPASESFLMSQFFASMAKVLEFQLQHQSFQWMNIQGWRPLGLIALSPCCPRDSQESSLAPQFKSTNSLALSFLYGPALTSVHDYRKNHSFDYILVVKW